MTDIKVSALTSYTNPDAANDVIPIVDTANTTTKKITRNAYLGLTSAPVGKDDTQTLTAKTLTAPTITSPILSGTITGTYTLAGAPTFPASVVTLTGSQTLTNKILTSPTLSAPTITNASISADAITGFSTANSGTIYGVAISSGIFTTNNIVPNNSLSNTGSFGSAWAWTSWTPTLVNASLGNGTFACKYTQIGKTILFRFVFLLGTTSTIGTAPTFSLPVTSVATPSTSFPIARGHYDNGGGQFNGYVAWTSTTTASLRSWDTNNNGGAITALAPGTFANGWAIVMAGEYDAA